MPTLNLTVRSIQGLTPGRTRYEVLDAQTPGLAVPADAERPQIVGPAVPAPRPTPSADARPLSVLFGGGVGAVEDALVRVQCFLARFGEPR